MMMRLTVMIAMAVMHEHMHQRAGQQEQIGQNSQYMGTVFGEQKESGNREETVEHPARSG